MNIPDDLMRAVKIRAAEQNRKLQDLISELLRLGLESSSNPQPKVLRKRVPLPSIDCAHEALPGKELTPEKLASVLIEDQARELV